MIDDRLAPMIRTAAAPAEPDPAFAATLYGELAGILGHAEPVPPRQVVMLQPVRPGKPWRLLVLAAAVALLILSLILVLAGTRPSGLADVRLDGANDARTGIHPGPGPANMPIEAWSLDVGPVNFTPVVDDGVLYFGGRDRRLRAVDAATGSEHWSFVASDEIEGAAAIGGGRIFFVDVSGALFAVDTATGRQAWRGSQDFFQGASPALVGERLYVGGGDGRLHVIDAFTGAEAWSVDAGAPITAVTVVDGAALLGTIDGQFLAVSIDTRKPVFEEIGLGIGSIDRIAATERHAYVALTDKSGPGRLVAVDRQSGRIAWSYTPSAGGSLRLGAVNRDRAYATTTAGVVALDAVTGQRRWSADAIGSRQGLAATEGTLFVTGDPSALVALDAATGSVRWTMPLQEDPSKASLFWYPQRGLPVITGGYVFVGDGAGMHAFAEEASARVAPWSGTSVQASQPAFADAVATFEAVPQGSATLEHPSGMDVAPDGHLYVIDAGQSQVVVIGPDGEVVDRWGRRGRGPGEFDFLREEADPASAIGGVAIAPDGTVYVADTVNDRVQAFTADGEFLFDWGATGTGEGEFIEPFDLDVCPDGRVIVVDDVRDDIQVFDSRGRPLDTIGRKGSRPGELLFTSSVVCTEDGTIVNADWDNNRVQAWDANGTFLWTVSGDPGDGPPMRLPGDVAVDDAGNILVVDRTRLLVFDPQRRLVAVWRPREHGLGRDPATIALDGRGHAYVGFPGQALIVRLTLGF